MRKRERSEEMLEANEMRKMRQEEIVLLCWIREGRRRKRGKERMFTNSSQFKNERKSPGCSQGPSLSLIHGFSNECIPI
jgi:hypothetical protein